MKPKVIYLSTALAVAAAFLTSPAAATPQFARRFELGCTACHTLPPQLNAEGLAFAANGYRLPPTLGGESRGAGAAHGLPATWITARYEDLGPNAANELFLPKVELVSGGALPHGLSYFAEWRPVSFSLRADGSQQDRSGRFEDLYLQWSPSERHGFKVGQFRALNQVDVSLRLSASEPQLFAQGLPTERYSNPRLDALARFSPSGRSPSLGYSFQSLAGSRASDGLFHHLTVPFAGELSIPLGREASTNASFELAAPKGLFAETYYRRGTSSVGAHAFVHDDAFLATALGSHEWRGLRLTAGFGIDDREGAPSRERGSLEAEYHFAQTGKVRAAAGLRAEEVSGDGRRARFVPYLALSAPNTRHTFLLQIEFVDQEGNDTLVVDLSALF